MISHRSARRAAAAALLSAPLLAAPAGAEDKSGPGPYAGLAIGASYVLEYASGARITVVLEERTEKGTVWGVIPGEDASGAVAARMVQDAAGRLTAFLDADGTPQETYAPHNCERVELLCRYTITDKDGAHVEQRFSEYDGRGWTYSIMRQTGDGLVGKRLGSVRYDADGVQVEAQWADLATARTNSVKRVK